MFCTCRQPSASVITEMSANDGLLKSQVMMNNKFKMNKTGKKIPNRDVGQKVMGFTIGDR